MASQLNSCLATHPRESADRILVPALRRESPSMAMQTAMFGGASGSGPSGCGKLLAQARGLMISYLFNLVR